MLEIHDANYTKLLNIKNIFTLAALMSSSAKHSAMDLMLRNAASRAPVQSNQMA